MKKNLFLFISIFLFLIFSFCSKKNKEFETSNNIKDTISFKLFLSIKMSEDDNETDKQSMSLSVEEVDSLLKSEKGKKILIGSLQKTLDDPVHILATDGDGHYVISGFKLEDGKIKQLKPAEIFFWDYDVNIIAKN
jgi:hypothetical protein